MNEWELIRVVSYLRSARILIEESKRMALEDADDFYFESDFDKLISDISSLANRMENDYP